jgi:cystathionine beta-lyase/cystathionine gamma-synthase
VPRPRQRVLTRSTLIDSDLLRKTEIARPACRRITRCLQSSRAVRGLQTLTVRTSRLEHKLHPLLAQATANGLVESEWVKRHLHLPPSRFTQMACTQEQNVERVAQSSHPTGMSSLFLDNTSLVQSSGSNCAISSPTASLNSSRDPTSTW